MTSADSREVPEARIHTLNDEPVRDDGEYVLYWMTAFRRTESNFALQRAAEWAQDLRKPLLILEALRVGYRWASDRLHAFIVQGMHDNRERIQSLGNRGVHYFPYVEPREDAGKGLLEELAARAAVVITDDFPCFFLPRMIAAVASRLTVRFEHVDGNGLFPMRATDQVFPTAYAFRRFLQKNLAAQFDRFPAVDPLRKLTLPEFRGLPDGITGRWPPAAPRELTGDSQELANLPIDHSVTPANDRGGATAARARLTRFLDQHLPRYVDDSNQPDEEVRSGLSPYLHFGHISPHEIFTALQDREEWSPDKLAAKGSGKKEGWWGMSRAAEAWLDELITWRELGYNRCAHTTDYDRYESLPEWARRTLEKHESDPRAHVYSLPEFAAAETHDPLWNAAQRQLVQEGRIHNYLRMLWGKKILEWTESPQAALEILIELNNKYALDGRNPNSYSGIFWCLGRYDRPWGPERPIFGTVRYMSSENTARKLHVKEYLKRFGK